jgi:hydrogenase maturation protein HypF
VPTPPVLAVGAQLKNTVCFTRGGEAHLSPHIGSLDDEETVCFFEETVAKLERLLGVRPTVVAHDLHPDYRSTRWARAFAAAGGRVAMGVQHHHAHVAACLIEHGRSGPAVGVAYDGTGCGPDGASWGGEVLLCDLAGFVRLGHLRPLALPGGEAAIREPWRLAVAALVDAGEALTPLSRIEAERRDAVARLALRGTTPRATGAGRWFDAVASLCGVRDVASYEGQAAIELEGIADPDETGSYAFAVDTPSGAPFSVDLRPVVRQIVADVRCGAPASVVSARFHETVARLVLDGCTRARDQGAPPVMALTGGCFANRRLSERVKTLAEADGFQVLLHRRVPAGDGGIALGQAAVAAYRCHQEGG